MGQRSLWAAVVYPWQSDTSSEQQERNKQQGQNGPRVMIGFCYLPPERVKIGQRSLWAAVVYPWQNETSSEQQDGPRVKMGSSTNIQQQERNKQQGHNGQRFKMGQGSRWVSVIYPLKKSKWAAVVYPLTESN